MPHLYLCSYHLHDLVSIFNDSSHIWKNRRSISVKFWCLLTQNPVFPLNLCLPFLQIPSQVLLPLQLLFQPTPLDSLLPFVFGCICCLCPYTAPSQWAVRLYSLFMWMSKFLGAGLTSCPCPHPQSLTLSWAQRTLTKPLGKWCHFPYSLLLPGKHMSVRYTDMWTSHLVHLPNLYGAKSSMLYQKL